MAAKFRVLALSGGGVRGLYTAAFLAKVEELSGKRFLNHFDLVVGTSTGGLIALAIGFGQSVESVRDFYWGRAPHLFRSPTLPFGLDRIRQLFRPKHNVSWLCEELQKRFGTEALLGQSRIPLVINSCTAADGKPLCFKTRHHAEFDRDHRLPAWKVAMATSAAPIYYTVYEDEAGTDFVDGGLWANCPVLVGAIEAIDRFGRARTDVDILSVGTTFSSFRLPPKSRRGGLLASRSVIKLMFETNRRAAMFMARRLVGPNSVVEIDHHTADFDLDDSRQPTLRDLRSFGEEDAKLHVAEIGRRFFAEPVRPWTPIG